MRIDNDERGNLMDGLSSNSQFGVQSSKFQVRVYMIRSAINISAFNDIQIWRGIQHLRRQRPYLIARILALPACFT